MAVYYDLVDQAAQVLIADNSSALNLESADAVGVVTAVFTLAVQVLAMYDARRTGTRDDLPFSLYDYRTHAQVNQRSISGMLSSSPYLLGVSLYFMLIGPLSGSFGQFLARLFDLSGFACVVSLFSSVMCLGSCLTRLRPNVSLIKRVLFGFIVGLISAFIGAAAIALNSNELVPWLVFIAFVGIYWLFGHYGRHHILKMKTQPEIETSAGRWGGASLVLLVTCGVIVACHVVLVALVNLPAIQVVCAEYPGTNEGTTVVNRYNPLLLAVEQTRYGSDGEMIITFNHQYDITRKMISYEGYWSDGSKASIARADYEIEEMLEDVRANNSISAYKLSDDGTGALVIICELYEAADAELYLVEEYDQNNPDALLKASYYDENLELYFYRVYNYKDDESYATGGTTYNADDSFSNSFTFEYYPSGIVKNLTYYNESGEASQVYDYDENGNLISE